MTLTKNFTCETCSKSFARSGDLVRHRRIHTGDKPYACTWPECKKVFSQSSGLTVHMNTHTKAKPHACRKPGCGKVFSDPSSRTRHCKEFHCKSGVYQCPVEKCSSAIKRRSAFAAHLRSKHGIEPSTLDIEVLNTVAAPLRSPYVRARRSSRIQPIQHILTLPKVSLSSPLDSNVQPDNNNVYFNTPSNYPSYMYNGNIAYNAPHTFQYPAVAPSNDSFLNVPSRSISPALTHGSSAASTPSPCRTPEPTQQVQLPLNTFENMKQHEQMQWLLTSLDAQPSLFTSVGDVPRQDLYQWDNQPYAGAGVVVT